jgi:hypothetical protein
MAPLVSIPNISTCEPSARDPITTEDTGLIGDPNSFVFLRVLCGYDFFHAFPRVE